MLHTVCVLAKRHVPEVAFHTHARIADIAAAHGIAHVVQRILAQGQRQIAHHLFCARAMKAPVQIKHAREAVCAPGPVVSTPGHARRALRITVGKADFRQRDPYVLVANRPLHLGAQCVE